MQNLSISPVALTTLTQWQSYSTSFFNRLTNLHQIGKISTTEHKMITAYLDKLNQAFKYYFSLKTLPKQTEQLQSLLAQLQMFVEEQKDSPVIYELLSDLKASLIATKKELLKPMAIDQLPPEILNQIASNNFTSRQTLNLAQCSSSLFFGDAGLSLLAKCKRLPELGKFKLTIGFACFLSIENKLFVWGYNETGQLGLGDNDSRNTPVEFDLTRLQLAHEDGVEQIVASRNHTLLLTRQGRCFVWGENGSGQLGLGHNSNRNSPVEFDLSRLRLAHEDGVEQIVASRCHTLLLTRQGRCFVWGHWGQLGLGDNVDRNIPTELYLARLQLAPEDGVAQVIAGAFHTLLLTRQGRCFVWGDNVYGQLGLGDNSHRNIPVEFDLTRLQLVSEDGVGQIVADGCHTFLLTRQGRCFVWGYNAEDQLGLGDSAERNIPVEFDLTRLQLATGDGVAQIFAGAGLLITQQGRCFVWGRNFGSELGLGYKSKPVSTPTEVLYPHLKELKNLWSSLQKEDLATLASLACNKANYSQTIYQLIIKRLVFENLKTRLSVIPLIQTSPWHQPFQVIKLLPFASLYEPTIETLKVKSSKEQQAITHALAKLLDVYDYFIEKNSSSEQTTRQEDFIELLNTFSLESLKSSDDFSKYLDKTAATRHLKNLGFTVLGFSVDSPIPHSSTRYFDVRQELLTEVKQQPEFLKQLKTAADILLQGLNTATEADGLAYTLRALLQPKQQLRPTRPGAGLSS